MNLFNLSASEFWMWWFLIGFINVLINGFVRKIETDGNWMFVIAWWFIWPMTPVGHFVRLVIYLYLAVKEYQPYRRAKIAFLRKF